MKSTPLPAIARLVELYGSPTGLAAKVNEKLPKNTPQSVLLTRQQIEAWLTRGWASPYRFHQLALVLPEGMTEHDLNNDRILKKVQEAKAKRLAKRVPSEAPSAPNPGRRSYDKLPPEPLRRVSIDLDDPERRSAPDRRERPLIDRRKN